MPCVPAARRAVLQVVLLLLAVPAGSAIAPQPVSVTLSAVKATLPVGALPVTVAVKVTFTPTFEGLEELVSVVVVAVPPEVVTLTVSALAVAERTMMLMP